MLRLPHQLTGRPVFVDPAAIIAITDAIEMTPARIQGAPPIPSIVGAIIVIPGAQLPIAGDASIIEIVVRRALGQVSEADAEAEIAAFQQTAN